MVELRDIMGLDAEQGDIWRIQALAIDGRSPVLSELTKWAKSEKADFRKIIKAMRFAAKVKRVTDPKHVKRCQNPDYADTYEFRADKGQARVMFFYDEREENLIVCTVPFFGKGGSPKKQDAAFKQCNTLKSLYESSIQ